MLNFGVQCLKVGIREQHSVFEHHDCFDSGENSTGTLKVTILDGQYWNITNPLVGMNLPKIGLKGAYVQWRARCSLARCHNRDGISIDRVTENCISHR